MVVLPTMLLLPPLSTFAAGASEVPFWMILHRAMRALDEPTTLTPVPLLFEIVVVSIGPAQAAETIRTALAMGADRGIFVKTATATEPLAVAKMLKAIVDAEKPGLVILGKQAIDDDCNQTGQMLAALLGWPQGTFASKLAIEGGYMKVPYTLDEAMSSNNILFLERASSQVIAVNIAAGDRRSAFGTKQRGSSTSCRSRARR